MPHSSCRLEVRGLVAQFVFWVLKTWIPDARKLLSQPREAAGLWVRLLWLVWKYEPVGTLPATPICPSCAQPPGTASAGAGVTPSGSRRQSVGSIPKWVTRNGVGEKGVK
jgi:hypothetical protein